MVDHLIFNRIRASVARASRHDETLRFLIVGNGEAAVRAQRQLLLEGVFVLGELGVRGLAGSASLAGRTSLTSSTSLTSFTSLSYFSDGLAETLIDLLEEGEVVIERLHIEIAIDVQLAIVRDSVTQTGTISQLCATHPVIGSIIRRIRGHPVEYGQLVQRQLIRSSERLSIVQRTSEVLDTLPYGVFPRLIVFWIEVFVDRQVAQGLLDLSLCT